MPEEFDWTIWQTMSAIVFVLAPMVIGVSVAGIFNRHIQAKKREELAILRSDLEQHHDAP